MTQLDALKLTDSIRNRLVDFAVDDNFVKSTELSQIARDIWSGPPDQGGLVSDIWVEGAFPSKTSTQTLDTLVSSGEFDADLRDVLDDVSAMPKDRLLYTHQLETIRLTQSYAPGTRPAIVATAGTGAGKTESFLLPILNDLYRTPPTNRRGGTRCIMLYPMNALVNDQTDRLYSWLHAQARVTLFHFTSETPEDHKSASRQGIKPWRPCRMRTRQEARGLESRDGKPVQGGPTPDIIITNYSMLEYMLCRPQDSVFFGPELRAIVLDEAHLYSGTLAAEITLLLRRLLIRCGRDPDDVLQFATSATLGTGDQNELRSFASHVFNKSNQLVHLVVGEAARTELFSESPPVTEPNSAAINARKWLDSPTIIDDDGVPALATADSCESLVDDLKTLVSHEHLQTLSVAENRPAVVLRETLPAAPMVHKLEQILWEKKHVPLTTLAQYLFQDASSESLQAVVRLLQLTASARRRATDYPLVPHRIHVIARPSDSLVVCINPACSGVRSKFGDLGAVSAGYHDTCEFCSSRTLSLERCRTCGEWFLSGQVKEATILPAFPKVRREEDFQDGVPERRLFRPSSGSDTGAVPAVYVVPATGAISGAGTDGTVCLRQHSGCYNCGAESVQIVSFYSGAPLTLSILAETLLAGLPEFPGKGTSNEWLPARGRRLLAFSDSRREAARLGPMLTNQHEQQLVRAAIIDELGSGIDPSVLSILQQQLNNAQQQLQISTNSDDLQQFWQFQVNTLQGQIAKFSEGGSVDWWCQSLVQSTVLSQILDRPTGEGHLADEWSQTAWESNRREVEGRIKELLGREFARPNRGASLTLEPLGLIEVTYPGIDQLEPPDEIIGSLPQDNVRQNITENWTGLLAAICDTLRIDGVVTLGDEDLDEGYDFGGVLIGRWATEDHQLRTQGGLIRFVGSTLEQRRRRFVAAVLRSCGMDEEDQIFESSRTVLRGCFAQLFAAAVGKTLPWLEADQRQNRAGGLADAIRINFFELALRKPDTVFRCWQTGHVWPRSVAGCAPEMTDHSTLTPVSADDLDVDMRLGRRRREYRESPIFKIGLWGEEHSAQLSPGENRRLQNLFKAGIRNVLSSTTTLELGIDIGGLNGVLMGNVPPGKANYLQRAGRAGRRADGSSVVTTFARPRPYDREVFQRIGDYLDAPIRQPVVLLDRERVARRHIHAFLLGDFFRSVYSPDQRTGAMDAYGRMGAFCAVPRTSWWESGNQKPRVQQSGSQSSLRSQFVDFLDKSKQQISGEIAEQVKDLLVGTPFSKSPIDWGTFIDDVRAAFDDACSDWQGDYDSLLEQWKQAGGFSQANALHYQLRLRSEMTVIEALSDRQFLPRYGFPIGVMKLRVVSPEERTSGRSREEGQFQLERQGLLALREYVPGSRLLAGGKLITSRGILKHWTGENIDTPIGIRGQYTECVNGHLYYWQSLDEQICPFCREIAGRSPTPFIIPRYGFSAAVWDPPKWSTATPEAVGEVETLSASFVVTAGDYPEHENLGGIAGLTALYREDGELLVYNEGRNQLGFALCLRCGYSDSERKRGEGRVDLPQGFTGHSPLNARRNRGGARGGRFPICATDAPVLRNQTLAARETTDVLLLDFSGCLNPSQQNDRVLLTTLGYALRRAAAQLLELDERELGVSTMPAGDMGRSLGILLYDNVPGGAGHVRELLEVGAEWLVLARTVLFVDDRHDRRCRSACLDCLLSFQTQIAMQQGLLDRPRALSVLSDLLDPGMPRASTSPPPDNQPKPDTADQRSRPPMDVQDRLRRVSERRARNRRRS